MRRTKVTILNSMAGRDFERALDQHVAWGLEVVDLKDRIFGKSITALTESEAERAAEMIQERGLSVYCLSTGLFYEDVEAGEAVFRDDHLLAVEQVLSVARVLKPTFIRLLAARTQRRDQLDNAVDYVAAEHSWLFDLYREAIERIDGAGYRATIENEAHACLLSTPQEVLRFFEALDGSGVCLTWDVQNFWQMGTYPTVEVYKQLRHLIGYYHLKGGIACDDPTRLCWRSALEDASWPVEEITKQVIRDGVSPVICLNPSHGQPKPGMDYSNLTERDLRYVRELIDEVEA